MSAAARAPDSQLTRARDQGRILLIRDEPTATAYRAALEEAGFAVVGVTKGTAALVELHRTRPHLVIADTNLKGITADELTKMLVEMEDSLPLVLVGDGEATPARRYRALASGVADYFQMPQETALLLARAAQLIKLQQRIERLRAEADRDYLTGLANRRRFRTALGLELERWRRYKTPCSLLLVDVDFMKRINDAHGHSAGDIAIRHIASSLRELSRDNDTAARLGGEEFALLLAGTNEASALIVAERLLQVVSAKPIENIGTVTISIGVASCPEHAVSERAIYAESDAALYRAKGEGRNRAVTAPSLRQS